MNKKHLKAYGKRITLLAVSAMTLLGCTDKSVVVNNDNNVNVKFWSADAISKVVQERGYEYYENIATKASLNYRMGQGEFEAAQIIMTPDGNINSYSTSISEITDGMGNKITPSKVKIYAQKYINVEGIYDAATNEKPGHFPDAILPIEASKKYNEDKIAKGNNQAIYVSIETELNQAPGTYTGEFTISVAGKDNKFPVTVEVLPIQISETTHSNSIFLNTWNYQFQELDGSQHMLDRYTEACIDYRLGTDKIVLDHYNDADTYMDYHVEKAYKYMQNPRYPTITIPYKQVYNNELQTTAFDVGVFKNYIRAYFTKSCETGFNMFKKSRVYLGIMDEPEEVGIIPQAIKVFNLYNKTIKEIADELESVEMGNPLHNELIDSIRNLQNVVTNKYNEDLDPYVETWCPKVNEYNRAYDRSSYADQKEKWWYTCVQPRAPYPTYHTEDGLPSARLLSWMQADYDISGNLYWATNNYAHLTSNGTFEPIEDVYENADFASNINGDGYLFYPGGQYGIDGPVPSIRIEAIRDGLEEYELLYDLKQQAKSIGTNIDGLMRMLTYSLYNGTKVHADVASTRKMRDELLDISVANKNGSDFLIYDYENIFNGSASVKFYAKEGTEIKVDGQVLTPGASLDEGHIYEVTKSIASTNNIIKIEVSYNGTTSIINHNFGGKTDCKNADAMKSGFTKYNASVTATVVDGSEVDPSIDYNMLKMEIGAPKNLKQSIKYTPSFLKDINSSASGFSLEVYNPTSDYIEFSIGGRFAKRNVDTYLSQNEMLAPGMNRIFIPTCNLNWSAYGSLSYLMFVFGNSDSTVEEAKTMYFGHLSIMNK